MATDSNQRTVQEAVARRAVLGFVLCAVCCMLMASDVLACPGCKEALFDPGHLAERLATAKGYALSIGVLLTVPFALVGGVTALVVRAARRSKRLS